MKGTIPIARRLVPLALALAGVQHDAVAQERPGLSLELGATSSTMKMDFEGAQAHSRNGVALGVMATVPLRQGLAFETGVTYVQKGVTARDPGVELGIDLGYLQIPWLLRYEWGGGRVRPFVMAGAAVALRATCRLRAKVVGVTYATDCVEGSDVTVSPPGGGPSQVSTHDILAKTDASIGGGAGIDVGRWRFGLRYDHGLRNLNAVGSEFVGNRSWTFFSGIRLGR